MKLLCVASAALVLSGCGYIGEPMVPLLNIPNRVTNLAAVERGSAIIYQFDLPKLTTEGKLAKIGKFEIRAGEAIPGGFNADEWAGKASRFEAEADDHGHVLSQIPAALWVGKEMILGVKVYGVNGRDAGWSNFATVPVVKPLTTPIDVQTTAVAEGVRVIWQGLAGQYRLFRRVGEDPALTLMATVETNEWLDTTTEYDKQYTYLIQAAQKTGDVFAESEISAGKSITPLDKFPPAVPVGLNAIAATQNIELVWERNTEPDLAGYRLYRALSDGRLEKFADIQDAPSYSDHKLESGKRYRYAISAVDKLGNESKLSEPVEATAP